MLENEKEEKIREREATLRERVPPLQLSGLSVQDLQVSVVHRWALFTSRPTPVPFWFHLGSTKDKSC